MEFEIGNLFYIVITMVAIIVGLLGKKKKPAGQGTGETEGRARPGFMENLEKAFNMGQEDQIVVIFGIMRKICRLKRRLIAPTQTTMI